MKGAVFASRSLAIGAVILGLLALGSTPVSAQTGQVKGKVVDAQGNPVEGADIVIEFTGAMSRRHETKTDKRGNFVQIGLQSGEYRVTASKEGMSQSFDVRIRLGNMSEGNFVLQPGSGGPLISKEDAEKLKAKLEMATATFEQGVALSQANQDEAAIAKFNEVIAAIETCGECHVNIGAIHARNKRYDEAEKAFTTAIAQNPSLPDAYNGLANVYNSQKRFDEAGKASAEALKLTVAGGGAGDASSVFNQGVILWNSGKIAEAKTQFEQALQLDPTLAEAHYWLAMALVNEGKLAEAVPEFEKYLELAPEGQYAAQAKGIVQQLKK